MVDQPVDHRGRDDVVGEGLSPPAKGQVRGDHHRALLVARRDELEEEIRCILVERDVAHLVDLCRYPHSRRARLYGTRPPRRRTPHDHGADARNAAGMRYGRPDDGQPRRAVRRPARRGRACGRGAAAGVVGQVLVPGVLPRHEACVAQCAGDRAGRHPWRGAVRRVDRCGPGRPARAARPLPLAPPPAGARRVGTAPCAGSRMRPSSVPVVPGSAAAGGVFSMSPIEYFFNW